MPKIIDKMAKKQDIVESAMKVFAQKGFANTKMADVAEAAKIGKGTIYEYFANKDEIFDFVFNHFMSAMETSVAKAILKITDPEEKIKVIFNSWADMVAMHTVDIIEIMLDFWAEAIRTKDEKKLGIVKLEKIYEDFRKIIKSIMDEGVQMGRFKSIDTYYAAALILGAMDGLMIQWIMNKKNFDVKKAIEQSTNILLTGICL